jgi:pimeloyl-ACP methyl ester carboxylesterase
MQAETDHNLSVGKGETTVEEKTNKNNLKVITVIIMLLTCITYSASIAANDANALECSNASFLEVPENYSQPTGRKIQVAYFRFPPVNKSHNDPVIYLGGGGPGGSVSRKPLLEEAAHATGREIIYLDYRGAGCSRPNLDCFEFNIPRMTSVNRALHCASRLERGGTNLRSYNTKALTEDIESLRRSLRVEQLNLIGASYGSRLALSYLSVYEKHARSAILNSPYPFGVDVFSDRLPGATRILAELIGDYSLSSLSVSEIETRMENFANWLVLNQFIGQPITGPIAEKELVRMLSYTPPVAVFGKNLSPRFLHEGLFYSVSCQEDIGSISSDSVVRGRLADQSITLAEAMFRQAIEGLIQICDIWPVKVQSTYPSIENISTPVLIIAQEYDIITPSEWGEFLYEVLPDSRLEVLSGMVHTQLYSSADKVSKRQILAMIQSLLHDPAVTVAIDKKR